MAVARESNSRGAMPDAAPIRRIWLCADDYGIAPGVNAAIRDLVLGIEPKRIKVEDILRIVSRHFAVSKADILSDRRHRSVVRPRQIGMYLAKQLTSRSLPEIGRRFGNRDHTTVLHAIRKIDKEIGDNPHLKEEIEELKRQLNR